MIGEAAKLPSSWVHYPNEKWRGLKNCLTCDLKFVYNSIKPENRIVSFFPISLFSPYWKLGQILNSNATLWQNFKKNQTIAILEIFNFINFASRICYYYFEDLKNSSTTKLNFQFFPQSFTQGDLRAFSVETPIRAFNWCQNIWVRSTIVYNHFITCNTYFLKAFMNVVHVLLSTHI